MSNDATHPPLWIAIRLPRLALDVFLRGAPTPEPFAISDEHRIAACDAKARARGIRPGMAETTALALAPQLRLKPRDRAAETEALLGVAAWAGQFTPAVVADFPCSVLLEVSASLRLWSGFDALLARLRAGLAELGFGGLFAAAPTARAAAWLALEQDLRSQDRRPSGAAPPCKSQWDAGALDATVAALPLEVLEAAHERMPAFDAIGAECIGDLLGLPRAGVARRFGQGLLDEIDQGLGRLADPRSFFTPPERFHAELELPFEVTQAEALLFAGQRLLTQLAGFLAARSAGVQRIAVKLFHRNGHSDVVIGLVAPSRDARHFTLLLRERLGRAALTAPVRALAVTAEDIRPAPAGNASLFPDAAAQAGSWTRLVEQLRARLGEQSVQGLALADEHRPEKASVPADVGKEAAQERQLPLALPQATVERPFWLLPAPRPIDEFTEQRTEQSAEQRDPSRLQLLAGPERIESGWWDGAEIARDYFIARSGGPSLLWVYRERPRAGASPHWYVHGVFS
jgi:protein ImuB